MVQPAESWCHPSILACVPLINGIRCIHRVACLRIMTSSAPEVSARHSWLAAQLLDSVARHDATVTHVGLSDSSFAHVCNELSLSLHTLQIRVLDLSFFTSLSDIDSPLDIHYLLSKVIPQRCQGRKFAVVALRIIEANPKLGLYVQDLVLCSLLGNYTISDAASRPLPDVRARLTAMLRQSPSGPGRVSRFLLRLLDKCRSVVMFCLREHLLFCIDEQPAVRQQIAALFDLDQFRQLVRSAMAAVRSYMSRMLCTANEVTSLSCAGDEDMQCTRWVDELDFVLHPFHSAILGISYRRPKQSFRQFLLTVCNKSYPVDADVPRLVSVDEIGLMRRLVERLSKWRFGLLADVVNWLPLFRVHASVVSCFKVLMLHHAQGVTAVERMKSAMVAIQRCDPRACQLLHIAAKIIQDTQRVQLVGRLPFAYVQNQIRACQARFGMVPVGASSGAMGRVLENLFYFVYCPVCFTVYSLLADVDSVYKQDYAYGFRDAVVDHNTREMYCHRERHTYRGCCDAQPLRQILLLGNVLSVNGKMVMICPQPGCGKIMVVSADCGTTVHGRACVYCTQKLRSLNPTLLEMLDRYKSTAEGCHCLVCETKLSMTTDVYYYGEGIYLCRRHHSLPLTQHLTKFMSRGASPDAASVKAFIVDFATKREASMREQRAGTQGIQRKLEAFKQTVKM